MRLPRPAPRLLRRLRRLIRRAAFGLAFAAGALGLAAQEPAGQGQPARVLTLDGAVSPATADYITRNLTEAAEAGAPLVVLRMDTPGGLDSSMRDIVRVILASPVPVATWVAPSGGRAASAGTYILYASHVAAMAPATHLGAATPVAIGGGGGGGGGDEGGGFPFGGPARDDAPEATDEGDDPGEADAPSTPARPAAGSAMEAKAINDAVAYIRGLAEMRGRNADWAERAVREAATLTATEAVRENVADFIADSLPDLMAQADGREVSLPDGPATLATAGLALEEVEPDWRTAILSVITNPNVALILMLAGVYGMIFEFLNPGALVPGTVGGISLLLGLYSLALLPLNWAGAGLILLGLALIVAEAFAPSFGILGIGGTVALVLGVVMLVDTDAPGIEVSEPLVAGVAVAGVASTFLAAWLARRSFRAPVVSGSEEMIGATARVTDWQGEAGHVWIHGERWQASGAAGLAEGETVRVRGIDGLVLRVARDD